MKKIALIATIAFMTFTTFAKGSNVEDLLINRQAKPLFYHNLRSSDKCRHHKHRHRRPKGPTGPTGPVGPPGLGVTGPTGATGPAGSGGLLGSYYADLTSQAGSLQTIILPDSTIPFTTPVQFSGTNINSGVSLSGVGNSIIVPADGNYNIDWNTAVVIVGTSSWVNFHFDLQKNGTTLLRPTPQAQCSVSITGDTNSNFVHGIPYISTAASVIVPLLANDEISLLLTIDGTEGNMAGDGVQIQSAQISATYHSPPP